MKTAKANILIFTAMLLVLFLLQCFFRPELRVRRFVNAHGEQIEERLAAGHDVYGFIDIEYAVTWEGEHSVTAFILNTRKTRSSGFFGCYYSPDDVPIPFRNMDVELSQDGHDCWVWEAEGDNHGMTKKIRDHWYYFEASL